MAGVGQGGGTGRKGGGGFGQGLRSIAAAGGTGRSKGGGIWSAFGAAALGAIEQFSDFDEPVYGRFNDLVPQQGGSAVECSVVG